LGSSHSSRSLAPFGLPLRHIRSELISAVIFPIEYTKDIAKIVSMGDASNSTTDDQGNGPSHSHLVLGDDVSYHTSSSLSNLMSWIVSSDSQSFTVQRYETIPDDFP
jgi:hypothetical protein